MFQPFKKIFKKPTKQKGKEKLNIDCFILHVPSDPILQIDRGFSPCTQKSTYQILHIQMRCSFKTSNN